MKKHTKSKPTTVTTPPTVQRFVIIGCGGGGSIFLSLSVRFIRSYYKKLGLPFKIILVDGDQYKPKNTERQLFYGRMGNKAQIQAEIIQSEFKDVDVEYFSDFVDEHNIVDFVKGGDFVFAFVDNHRTRKRLSDRCRQLNNIDFYTCGNFYEDGDGHIYIRRDGRDLIQPITKDHPEIEFPTDTAPDKVSCLEEQETSEPQLVFANAHAALSVIDLMYNWLVYKKLKASGIYFDMGEMNQNLAPILLG